MADETTETTETETQETTETVTEPSTITQAEAAKLRADATKYHRRAQAAEAAAKDALTPEQREEYAEMKANAQQAEDDRKKTAGEFDELLAQKVGKANEEKTAVEAERDVFRNAFEREAVMTPIQAALAAAGVTNVSDAAFLIQNRHENRATATLTDGKAVVNVVDGEGHLVTDAGCDPGQSISIESLVKGWLGTATGKQFLPPSGDTGSGAHKGSPSGVTIEELDANPAKKGAFIQEHGTAAYLALAAKKKKT